MFILNLVIYFLCRWRPYHLICRNTTIMHLASIGLRAVAGLSSSEEATMPLWIPYRLVVQGNVS
jgi:hypothetical protein